MHFIIDISEIYLLNVCFNNASVQYIVDVCYELIFTDHIFDFTDYILRCTFRGSILAYKLLLMSRGNNIKKNWDHGWSK